MHHLLNKYVLVKDYKTGVQYGGLLTYVGINAFFPSWGLVCTVDRMPGIHIRSHADIRHNPNYAKSTPVTKGR